MPDGEETMKASQETIRLRCLEFEAQQRYVKSGDRASHRAYLKAMKATEASAVADARAELATR